LPVTIVSQSSVPQSGSFHASAMILAASSADGGRGLDIGTAGGSAKAIGYPETYFRRTARRNAPLRIWCM
jgi:hypothetical protein